MSQNWPRQVSGAPMIVILSVTTTLWVLDLKVWLPTARTTAIGPHTRLTHKCSQSACLLGPEWAGLCMPFKANAQGMEPANEMPSPPDLERCPAAFLPPASWHCLCFLPLGWSPTPQWC